MRFVRVFAAMAALVCSAVAGQAWAIQTFTLSTTLTPQNSVWQFSDGGIGPEFQTITFRASSPVTGFMSILFDLTAVKYVNGQFQHYTDFRLAYDTVLNGQRSASFQAGCPRSGSMGPNYRYTYQCDHWAPPAFGVSLDGLTQPVNVSLSGWSPTPEPATWALLILGFGGIGAAMRARSKSQPAAPQARRSYPC